MNCLPLDIENIIIDYKNQLEHSDKFQLCLEKIPHINWNVHETHISSSVSVYYHPANKYIIRSSWCEKCGNLVFTSHIHPFFNLRIFSIRYLPALCSCAIESIEFDIWDDVD